MQRIRTTVRVLRNAAQTPFGLIAVFVCGVALGWLFLPSPLMKNAIVNNRGAVLYQSDNTYSFIDPLLACDIGTESAFPELAPAQKEVQSVVQSEIKSGKASSISVYLRSLKGARWFEINGDTTYAPASLMKVFVMMAYFKEDDDLGNNSVLSRQLVFRGSPNPAEDTPGQVIPHLTNGVSYSIEELINQMIVYSDNDAMNTLIDGFDNVTYKDFQSIFTDLKIPPPPTQSEVDMNFMSVEQYAMVFRVLFGSTYLSREYSERALSVLSKAQYKDGIVAGVPQNTTVAHKFGVRSIPPDQNGGVEGAELHDCGIVYYPGHPYLLCIMTRGTSFGALQNTLQNVSAATYTAMDAFYKSGISQTMSTVAPTASPR